MLSSVTELQKRVAVVEPKGVVRRPCGMWRGAMLSVVAVGIGTTLWCVQARKMTTPTARLDGRGVSVETGKCTAVSLENGL